MAWALVQRKSSGESDVSSLAYDSGVTAGNLLIAVLKVDFHTADPNPLTDTLGNTWNGLTIMDHPDQGLVVAVCYTITGSSGANTVTRGGGGTYYMRIYEFSGNAAASVLDAQNANTFGLSTALDSGNIVTTVDGDLLFGAGGQPNDAASHTFTPGSGYTGQSYDDTAVTVADAPSEWKAAGAAGSYNASYTSNVNARWVMKVAAFKPAVAAGVTFAYQYQIR